MGDDKRDQSQYQGKGKKGARPESLHTERPRTIPPPPDWEAEQAVIREALKRGHIQGLPLGNGKSGYDDLKGLSIIALRRRGYSERQIAAETGIPDSTIWRWRDEHPELEQEYQDAYEHYVLDLAEEQLPRAEELVTRGTYCGRKLSKIAERDMEIFKLALANHRRVLTWQAAKRARQTYGDNEQGNDLVIVQPMVVDRVVTQNPAAAEAHRREEDGDGPSDESQVEAQRDTVPSADGPERPRRARGRSAGSGNTAVRRARDAVSSAPDVKRNSVGSGGVSAQGKRGKIDPDEPPAKHKRREFGGHYTDRDR